MENFAKFIQCYGKFDGEYMGNDKYLALWKENKDKYLRELLGGSLKLEKKISLEESSFNKNMKFDREMEKFRQTHDSHRCAIEYASKIIEASGFKNIKLQTYKSDAVFDYIEYYNASCVTEHKFGRILDQLCFFIMGGKLAADDYQNIPCNREDTIEFSNGKKFQYQGKLIKAVKRFAKTLEVELSEEFYDYLNDLAVTISQICNSPKTESTIVLSIDPIDYVTASDNTYNWSSCMSWQNDGEYHTGTLEVMNSTNTLVAYVKGEEDVNDHISKATFSNKKWRKFIVVEPDIVASCRAYPYESSVLDEVFYKWIAELAKENLSWEYEADIPLRKTERANRFEGIHFEAWNYMYNDFECHCGVYMLSKNVVLEPRKIYWTATAHCPVCGNECVDSNITACYAHSTDHCCDECGTYGCNVEWDEDAQMYLCDDCYHSYHPYCESCHENWYNGDSESVRILFGTQYLSNDTAFCVSNGICPDCLAEGIESGKYVPIKGAYNLYYCTEPDESIAGRGAFGLTEEMAKQWFKERGYY